MQRMKFLAAALLLLSAGAASGEILESFNLDDCAWRAENIVVVSGDKVLFLPLEPKWVSTVWIESHRAFVYQQLWNPGPLELVPLEMSEREVLQRVDEVRALKKKFEEALQSPDAARTVLPLMRFNSAPVRLLMIGAMQEAGPNGVAALQAILGDASLLDLHDDAILALAKAGAIEAGPQLTELLKQALEYWKTIPDAEFFDHQIYARTYATLWALRTLRYAEAYDTVLALRELWQSVPQLRSLDQIAQECDGFLKGR